MERIDPFAAPRRCGLHLLTAWAVAAAAVPLGACARNISYPAPAHEVDVEIVDRTTGERLPIYEYRGERWVAGAPGHRYAVGVRNLTQGRMLAVMSVDGVNVLSGETAGWDQRGYVFGPLERYDIAGWRKSQERVAAFEFSSVPNSYASRTGRPKNVGVIGVAVFREAERASAQSEATPAPRRSAEEPPSTFDRAESAPGSPAAAKSAASNAVPTESLGSAATAPARQAVPAPRLGTAHGPSEESYVSFTNFERARSTPDEIVTIRYDRREALVAMGIIAAPHATPDPFPSASAGFVPDPPSR